MGLGITRGIRQGCPLALLLIAAVSELLLRRLRRLFLHTVGRAWADDLAMILRDFISRLDRIQDLYGEFASIFGLHVNIGKQFWCRFFRLIHWR